MRFFFFCAVLLLVFSGWACEAAAGSDRLPASLKKTEDRIAIVEGAQIDGHPLRTIDDFLSLVEEKYPGFWKVSRWCIAAAAFSPPRQSFRA